jgi:hypothetical protein
MHGFSQVLSSMVLAAVLSTPALAITAGPPIMLPARNAVAVGAPSAPASAVCPNCGKVHGRELAPRPSVSVDQQWAQREANLQAARGRMGHLMGCSPNARFSGVGMSSNPNRVPTCTPRSRMTLIGDATARGRNGMYYRSRHWR